MDSMRGQGGIQMLLGAEQEAQQIVSRARNMKMTRLRQAKDQAEGETAACRASLEEEHQRKISENIGSSGWNVKRLEEETEVKIKSFKDATSSIHKNAVNMLLKQVTAVKN